MTKIAYVGPTPAYYFVPFLRLLANENNVSLMVYWGSDEATKPYLEVEFGQKIESRYDLLEGYDYKFLKNFFGTASYQKGFWGLNSLDFFYEFKVRKYDYIIIHGWQYCNNIIAIIAAILYGQKILLRAETPHCQEKNKPIWKKLIKKIILGMLFKVVDGFLYIGEENKKFYKTYGIDSCKLFFAPYSVDNENLSNISSRLSSKQLLRKKLGFKCGVIYFIFVGKLIQKKRPDVLLDAFNMLGLPNVGLIFVGSGELFHELERKNKLQPNENIHFVGYKTQDELPRYLKLSDVFVLPSGDGETWGLVTNEAMNFGLPIILSDAVGSSTDLATKETGFIFKLDCRIDLADKMRMLATDHSLRMRMSTKALERINEYSPRMVVNGILEAIKH